MPFIPHTAPAGASSRWNDRLRHLMTSPSLADDESEIIRHFVEGLYKCEYLILMRRAG